MLLISPGGEREKGKRQRKIEIGREAYDGSCIIFWRKSLFIFKLI